MSRGGKAIIGLGLIGLLVGGLWLRRRNATPSIPSPSGRGLVGRAYDMLIVHGEPYVPIPFAYDSSEIPVSSQGDLNAVADYLKANTAISIEIRGHTDSQGSDDYNWNLAESRAQAVYYYLVDQGVGQDRLYAVSKGESSPIADNATEAGRALNRRVEFVVV